MIKQTFVLKTTLEDIINNRLKEIKYELIKNERLKDKQRKIRDDLKVKYPNKYVHDEYSNYWTEPSKETDEWKCSESITYNCFQEENRLKSERAYLQSILKANINKGEIRRFEVVNWFKW